MEQFIAAVWKELILLRRDRSGLLVLFAMPAVLVLVITLVQDNAMKSMGESETEILFIDNDRAMVGRHMEKTLSKADGVHLIKTLDGKIPDEKTAIQATAKGNFQFCLIIPQGITAKLRTNARIAANQAFSSENESSQKTPDPAEVMVYFDPTVTGGFRSTVQYLLQLLLLEIEVQEKMNQLAELLPTHLNEVLTQSMGSGLVDKMPKPPVALNSQWAPDAIINLRMSSAKGTAAATPPNAVQQNIPAWSLFGIFFIVLPMAGSFIKERLCGVQQRILSLPVSYLTIVAGKSCAYALVCTVQISLILLIGKTILPLFGTPYFELGSAPIAASLVAMSAILAATSYGILLGTVVRSYEQASMFGPISIVIAAAIGGIMVPVYAMPAFMQRISAFSPLAWAQNAFLELFVRGGTLPSVAVNVALLLTFALACNLAAWLVFLKRVGRGGA